MNCKTLRNLQPSIIIRGAVSLMLALCILLLSSCSLISQVLFKQSLKSRGYITEYGFEADLSDEYNEKTEDTINDLLSEIESLVKENDSADAPRLTELYGELEDYFYILSDHSDLIYVSFCQQPNDESLSAEHERISGVLTDFYARINSLYDDIYEGALADSFFADWNEEDIEEALFLSKTYSEEFANLTKERDKYVQLYEQLNQSSTSFRKKSSEYYEQIVAKNRSLALLAGAKNYPSYADKYIYGRDYDEEQIERFVSYVKDYIVPLGEELMTRISSSDDYFTLECEFEKLCQQDIGFSLMKETLTPYYNALGSDFADAFASFDNRIFTAKNENSLSVAFTAYQQNSNTPICYFGPGYQTLSTYVHEQGHYFSFALSESSISSIDLCETHSQANEWLYLAYAESLYEEALYDELTAYYLLNQVITITLSACCDTFERAVYDDESLTAEDYDALFVNCVKELGAYSFLNDCMGSNLENYWHLAVISNSMYYLSYAVSLIPSIEFYLIAKEDGFSYAAELYHDLCTVDANASFHQTIIQTTLSSPFEKEVFERIYDTFSPVKTKIF